MLIDCLSIVAPNGSRIASGEKTLEVRSWQPPCLPIEQLLIVENQRYLRDEEQTDEDGLAVAVVRIGSYHPWHEEELAAACATRWDKGHFAWVIEEAKAIQQPFRITAKRGVYRMELDAKLLGG